jgi:Leucine-rich repeat (LRR) protein
MITEINTYLNSLSVDILTLSIDGRGITKLPDLTRFKNLKELYCSNNQLSSSPTTLPQTLEILFCSGNKLTSLPDLPKNLKELYLTGNELSSLPTLPQTLEKLYCSDNKLTSLPNLTSLKNLVKLECCNNELSSLPTLPQNLKSLFCFGNKLTYLPNLPENILHFIYWDNPICDILDNDNNSLMKVKQNIQIVNNFRHLIYSLRSKKRFMKWLWKSKEKKIMEKYNPNYLLENLKEDTDLDEFLNNW